MSREVLLRMRITELARAEKSARATVTAATKSLDLTREERREIQTVNRRRIAEARVLQRQTALETRALAIGGGGIAVGGIGRVKSALDAARERAEQVSSLVTSGSAGALASLSQTRLLGIPGAGLALAAVLPLLDKLRQEIERKFEQRLEDARRSTLVEVERAVARADYSRRLREEPGFERAEAARVGALEDEAERQRAAAGLTPVVYWDRW